MLSNLPRAWGNSKIVFCGFIFCLFLFNSPTINSTKFYVQNGSEVVWSNKTVKWTYKYLIFAVDGGAPKRGDSISVTITFDVSCESTGAIVADPVTGDVFFRAPGLTGSIYRKTLVSYNIFTHYLTIPLLWIQHSVILFYCHPLVTNIFAKLILIVCYTLKMITKIISP